MSKERYIWAVNLADDTSTRLYRPDGDFDLAEAEVFAPGKCATIQAGEGTIYVAGDSRCAARLWREATGSDDNRPNPPWAAYQGLSEEQASKIAWAWLTEKQLA